MGRKAEQLRAIRVEARPRWKRVEALESGEPSTTLATMPPATRARAGAAGSR